MNYILCLEDREGMAFNHRRLSRDEALMKDLMTLLDGKTIYADEYSAKLFDEYGCPCKTAKRPEEFCGEDEYIFDELTDPAKLPLGEEYIIYRWNRRYPADTFCSLDLTSLGFEMVSDIQFEGKSHQEIDREIWRKK